MSNFSLIAIIYNPNSTGPSDEVAKQLASRLKDAGVTTEVQLIATERAGHAIELAYDLARNNERPLIISSSGDGGYNEVVNGALRAQDEGATPVCAVLAAGNANDHSRTVMTRRLDEAIVEGRVDHIDVLEATIGTDGSSRSRYAHSYIGIGLTPTVAVELNRNKLNRIKETYIVYKALKDLQPVEILVGRRVKKVDSLVMANISQMAKVMTIATGAEPDDGQFRMTVLPYRGRARLMRMLVKAVVRGTRGAPRTRFEFTSVKDMVVQFDGEIEELKAGERMVVQIRPGMLSTLR